MLASLRASDPSIRDVKVCRWRLLSERGRTTTPQNLDGWSRRSAVQLFEDADEPALLAVTFNADTALTEGSIAWPPSPPTGADVQWVADAELVARWRAARADAFGCLVVVRQPLIRPDREAQLSWISTVLRGLEGDKEPPAGLLNANFFASRDGRFVLNFAEWTSPDAHREALARGRYGQHGSIGSSALWRATREHPAITPQHEVHRYLPLCGSSEAARAA